MKDYDYDIKYHLGKANEVIDDLNRKVFLLQFMVQIEIQTDLDQKKIELISKALTRLEIKSMLVKENKVTQLLDDWCR